MEASYSEHNESILARNRAKGAPYEGAFFLWKRFFRFGKLGRRVKYLIGRRACRVPY